MGFTLRDRNGLPTRVANEFDSLTANITGFTRTQHDDNGAHTDITADSVESTAGYFERGRNVALGEWPIIEFIAANYTANGAMTWTVGADDNLSFFSTVIGNTVMWSVAVRHSTVGGTLNSQLIVKIPGRYTSAQDVYGTFSYVDNGGAVTLGRWSITSNTNYIVFEKPALANWTASTDQTYIFASGFFALKLPPR